MNLSLALKVNQELNLKPGDEIYFIGDSISDFVIIKRLGESSGALYYAKNGKLLLEENEFDDVVLKGRENTRRDLLVSKGGEVGLITAEGNIAVPIKFREIVCKLKGSFIVRGIDGKYGVYSDNGDMIIAPIYNQFTHVFGTEYFLSKGKKRSCVISQSSKVIVETEKTVYVYPSYTLACSDDTIEVYVEIGKLCEIDGQYCRRINNWYLEVIRDNKRGLVRYEDGSIVIPFKEYTKFKKDDNIILAQKSDGSFDTFTIDDF